MGEPGALRVSVQFLERQLRVAREDPEQHELVPWLEQELQRIHAEQKRLIEKFVPVCYPGLLHLAARFVGRRSAQDVAQNAFLRLLRWVTTRPLDDVMRVLAKHSELEHLLRRMTVRSAIDWYRRRRPLDDPPMEDDAEAQLASPQWQSLPRMAVEMARLERAYDQLSPAQRTVHVLHYHCGHTDTEIAQMLGMKKTSVRTHAARANVALKRAMEDNDL